MRGGAPAVVVLFSQPEAVVGVETPAGGKVGRVAEAQVPLAYQVGGVASLGQQLRQ